MEIEEWMNNQYIMNSGVWMDDLCIYMVGVSDISYSMALLCTTILMCQKGNFKLKRELSHVKTKTEGLINNYFYHFPKM